MTSRLLASIDADIAAAGSALVADCHRARRARYLIRVGRGEEGAATLKALRETHASAPVAELTAGINLAEGLASFFSGNSTPALDKIRRAYAIACSMDVGNMRAVCAAWLAHLEFGFLDIANMTAHLQDAFSNADALEHEARSRASLVAAVALHSSNRYDLAKGWYSNARVHAITEGDDATVSALLHNMASMGVMNLRQSVLTGSGESKLVLDALMGADSTSSYDDLKGMLGLSTWVPLLRAYVASLVGDPSQALILYRQHVEEALREGQRRMLTYIQADIAWCYLQTRELSLALSTANDAVELSLDPNVHIDDRAAAHSRLSEVFEGLQLPDLASHHHHLADACWHEYTLIQRSTVDALGRLDVNASV